jgi:hypothetical protein
LECLARLRNLELRRSLRGGPRRLLSCRRHEVILAGPADTGKTFACLVYLDWLAWEHPGSSLVMARKVRDTIHTTCLQTFVRKVLRRDSPVTVYGGDKPQHFTYPNGSRLWLAGMDDPGKVLSGEHDFVYVNQAEELELADWETLASRASGRAGHAPYAQIYGDANPGPPTHWILKRSSLGTLRLLNGRHEDNPELYDDAGNVTDQGRARLAVLDALTGLRYDRLRLGRWVQAEGVVYPEWDPRVHVIDPFEVPKSWPRVWSVDFGFTNPFAWLGCAVDDDGRLYVTRQVYHTRRLVSDHARRIAELTRGEPAPAACVCDHDAEGRATLEAELGLATDPAVKKGAKRPGVQAVAARLRVQGDGKPRLYVFRDSLDERDRSLESRGLPACLEEEFPGYSWKEGKEEPADGNDHSLDALRYLVFALDAPSMSQEAEELG